MLDQRIAPNQYIDRNGNVRTRAIRHSLAAAERRAAANVVPDKTPWRVLVRFGATLSRIDVHRFASEHAARTFAASLA
jgi:hypothetical protein